MFCCPNKTFKPVSDVWMVKVSPLELQYDKLNNLLLLSVTYQAIWHCLCAHVKIHKVLIVSCRVIDCHGR